MKLDRETQLKLMRRLNWDYTAAAEDMLDVVYGKKSRAGAFDRDALFVRSLERLPWHMVVALWGVETMKRLYTPEVRARIWPADRKETFDVAFAIHEDFEWSDILTEARSKDAGVEANVIGGVLVTVPKSAYDDIRWIGDAPGWDVFRDDMKRIADDMVCCGRNTLCMRC